VPSRDPRFWEPRLFCFGITNAGLAAGRTVERFVPIPLRSLDLTRKRRFSPQQWHCFSGCLVRERDHLRADDPTAPRILLPRLSLLQPETSVLSEEAAQ
jgi:hypothetical protein